MRLDRHEKVKFTLEVNVRLAVMQRSRCKFRLQAVADGKNDEG